MNGRRVQRAAAAAPALPVDGHSVAAHNGVLYVFGGRDAGGELLNGVWQMDLHEVADLPQSKPRRVSFTPLTQKGDVPAARCYHTAHVYQSGMYVVHGLMRDSGPADNVAVPVLQLASGEWRTQATTGDHPPLLCHHAGAVVGSDLFVTGGYGFGSSQQHGFYFLDLTTSVWRRLDAAAGPRVWGHSMLAVDGKLMVLGGVSTDTGLEEEELWVWHCQRREWKTSPRGASLTVRAVRDFNPDPSGADPARSPTTLRLTAGEEVQVLAQEGEPVPPGWMRGRSGSAKGIFPGEHVTEPSAPLMRSSHSSVAVGGRVYVWGGERGDPPERLADFWSLDAGSGKWRRLDRDARGPAPPPAIGLPCVSHGGSAVLVNPSERTVHAFDPAAALWSSAELDTDQSVDVRWRSPPRSPLRPARSAGSAAEHSCDGRLRFDSWPADAAPHPDPSAASVRYLAADPVDAGPVYLHRGTHSPPSPAHSPASHYSSPLQRVLQTRGCVSTPEAGAGAMAAPPPHLSPSPCRVLFPSSPSRSAAPPAPLLPCPQQQEHPPRPKAGALRSGRRRVSSAHSPRKHDRAPAAAAAPVQPSADVVVGAAAVEPRASVWPSAGDAVELGPTAGRGGCLRPGETGTIVAVKDYTVLGPRGDISVYREAEVRPAFPPSAGWQQPGM